MAWVRTHGEEGDTLHRLTSSHFFSLPPQGAEPFDEVQGWYRAHRGLAGSIRYTCQRMGWTIWTHGLFPAPLRRGVTEVLLVRRRAELAYDHIQAPPPTESGGGGGGLLGSLRSQLPHRLMSLPLHVVYYILEFMVRLGGLLCVWCLCMCCLIRTV